MGKKWLALALCWLVVCPAFAEDMADMADMPEAEYAEESYNDEELDALLRIQGDEDISSASEVVAPIIDSKVHTRIVTELGDNRIEQTYTHVKSGGVIGLGDKDATFRGLQLLLNMLGGDLEVDGSIGEKSMALLADMQAIYGMAGNAGVVGRGEFEELLVNAYIVRDPITAGSLLGPDHDRQVRYVLGALNVLRGKHYSAKKQFDTLNTYKDGAARAQACIIDWPQNGLLEQGQGFGAEDCLLTVRTSRPRERATYMKVLRGGKMVCSLFIAGTAEVSVTLPKGTYSFLTSVGSTWYGPVEGFGDSGDCFYQQLSFGDKERVDFKQDKQYTLILGGAPGNNVSTRDISPSDFH